MLGLTINLYTKCKRENQRTGCSGNVDHFSDNNIHPDEAYIVLEKGEPLGYPLKAGYNFINELSKESYVKAWTQLGLMASAIGRGHL